MYANSHSIIQQPNLTLFQVTLSVEIARQISLYVSCIGEVWASSYILHTRVHGQRVHETTYIEQIIVNLYCDRLQSI